MLRTIWAGLEAEGRARVASWFGGEVETRSAADMRYGEQVFEITVLGSRRSSGTRQV